jgi:hypothetical protein
MVFSLIGSRILNFFHVVPIFTELGQDLTHLPHTENTQSVAPVARVLSPAWAPRGLHRAMFMNSVSHGKAWIKNAASPLKKPCFAKECMLGGNLSKNLSSPPPTPPPPPSNCQLGPITFCLRIGQLGGEGVGGSPKSRAGREVLCHMVSPPPTNQPYHLALDTSQCLTREVTSESKSCA